MAAALQGAKAVGGGGPTIVKLVTGQAQGNQQQQQQPIIIGSNIAGQGGVARVVSALGKGATVGGKQAIVIAKPGTAVAGSPGAAQVQRAFAVTQPGQQQGQQVQGQQQQSPQQQVIVVSSAGALRNVPG